MNTFVIHKYKLNSMVTVLDLPLDFEVLHFDRQNGEFFIWAKHDPATKSTCRRNFRIVYTGEHVSYRNPMKYINTVLDNQHSMVYHLFMEDI